MKKEKGRKKYQSSNLDADFCVKDSVSHFHFVLCVRDGFQRNNTGIQFLQMFFLFWSGTGNTCEWGLMMV